jgi:hypothetical protein
MTILSMHTAVRVVSDGFSSGIAEHVRVIGMHSDSKFLSWIFEWPSSVLMIIASTVDPTSGEFQWSVPQFISLM